MYDMVPSIQIVGIKHFATLAVTEYAITCYAV